MADEISFLPLGAIIQSFKVGGVDIVQGFPTQAQYEAHNSPFFGETIGRVANRISGATIGASALRNSVAPATAYALPPNNGPNTLHGGPVGWGKRVWDGPAPLGVKAQVPGLPPFATGGESVRFALHSEHGDQGFPGDVDATVTYTVGKIEDEADGVTKTVLAMEYEAELVGDGAGAGAGVEETVVNMTNHSYFNLGGGPTIEGTRVQLCTAHHLPVDDVAIPTGDPTPYPDPAIAAGRPFELGATAPDVDHCFVVDPSPAAASSVPLDTRGGPLTRLVAADHPASGVHLEVLSTEPAFQFYTGKFIDVPAVDGAPARGPRAAFCVEPSRYVNAVNEDRWRSQVLLPRGQKYGARIVYKAWKV